jgi:hypothetical protein
MRPFLGLRYCTLPRRIGAALLSLGVLCTAAPGPAAQDVPLISGGLGFLTFTNGGVNYQTIAAPLLAAPIGPHLLIESRGNLAETFPPQGNGQGYNTSHFFGWAYLQADYIATSHLTVVGGYFLAPFGTYNERLSPIWTSNLQDAPLYPVFGC